MLLATDYLKAGILICLFMGIRIGELCALKWQDIDLEADEIRISKTIQRIKNTEPNPTTKTKIIIDTPKSETSIRAIPIPDFLFKILKALKSNNDCYFLTGKPDKFIEPRLYQMKFKKFLEECKIRDVTFHTLRHTFATRAVESGFDTKSLSEIIGHTDINFTYRRYVHPSMIHKKAHLEKMSIGY